MWNLLLNFFLPLFFFNIKELSSNLFQFPKCILQIVFKQLKMLNFLSSLQEFVLWKFNLQPVSEIMNQFISSWEQKIQKCGGKLFGSLLKRSVFHRRNCDCIYGKHRCLKLSSIRAIVKGNIFIFLRYLFQVKWDLAIWVWETL